MWKPQTSCSSNGMTGHVPQGGEDAVRCVHTDNTWQFVLSSLLGWLTLFLHKITSYVSHVGEISSCFNSIRSLLAAFFWKADRWLPSPGVTQADSGKGVDADKGCSQIWRQRWHCGCSLLRTARDFLSCSIQSSEPRTVSKASCVFSFEKCCWQ